MNTQEERDVVETHWFDPFPEPQTIPAGWDLSTLLSNPQPASASESDASPENSSC
ncbi:MAG: hypothetical protein QY332_20275 [Anaerolineales bacterium]|nr:MAG: hypothetical protein QY332_20275 [Anaerolineales bacterium]